MANGTANEYLQVGVYISNIDLPLVRTLVLIILRFSQARPKADRFRIVRPRPFAIQAISTTAEPVLLSADI